MEIRDDATIVTKEFAEKREGKEGITEKPKEEAEKEKQGESKAKEGMITKVFLRTDVP